MLGKERVDAMAKVIRPDIDLDSLPDIALMSKMPLPTTQDEDQEEILESVAKRKVRFQTSPP